MKRTPTKRSGANREAQKAPSHSLHAVVRIPRIKAALTKRVLRGGRRSALRCKMEVPIYEAVVQLIVSNDIYGERKKPQHVALFGECTAFGGRAFCSYSGEGNFALFFRPDAITHRVIAHEVFHLTHRILEWASVRVDSDNHEAGALLMGYLHAWAYGKLGKIIQPE